MERAKSSARGTDISRINDKLPGWLNNSELIVKASRGFCHRDTAQLLMPAKMPYTETYVHLGFD